MGHREEVLGQLVVAGSNAVEVLQLEEEALDQVALAAQPCAEVSFDLRFDTGRKFANAPFSRSGARIRSAS